MKFNEKLYNLRKQKGLSQEELAYRLNVSRQTVSKWETGDCVPDMEKLIAISEFFGLSLDELALDKEKENADRGEIAGEWKRSLWTEENKRKVKKGLKIALIALGIIFAIDLVSMILYFTLQGLPS